MKPQEQRSVSEVDRIRDQFRRAFEGEAWHGPAVLALLEGVTAQQAAAQKCSVSNWINGGFFAKQEALDFISGEGRVNFGGSSVSSVKRQRSAEVRLHRHVAVKVAITQPAEEPFW